MKIRSKLSWFVLGVAAMVSLGAVVYIDSTANFLRVGSWGVQLVVTNNVAFTANKARFELPGNFKLGSNIVYTNIFQTAGTNDAAVTNLTIDYNQPINYFRITNNATLTNFVNVPTNGAANTLVIIESIGTFYAITWPTLGAPSFGTYWNTNDNAPLWTSATNGQKTCASLTAIDTQVLASVVRFK